jgi:dTDP-4-dehydrorhamnose reductase
MRFLLLGGTGQVGQEFCALALPKDVEVVAPSRGELNLEDLNAIARMIAAQPWSAVINAAAYTDVDRAESQEAAAFAVNAEARHDWRPRRGAAEFRLFISRPITFLTGEKERPISNRMKWRR